MRIQHCAMKIITSTDGASNGRLGTDLAIKIDIHQDKALVQRLDVEETPEVVSYASTTCLLDLKLQALGNAGRTDEECVEKGPDDATWLVEFLTIQGKKLDWNWTNVTEENVRNWETVLSQGEFRTLEDELNELFS